MTDGLSRPKVPPIYQSAAYVFDGLDEVDAVQEGTGGYIYGRHGTPNASFLAAELAELERSEAAVITASGMGALFASLLHRTDAGGHIVAQDTLYGGTMQLLSEVLPRWGVTTTFCDATDVREVAAAVTDRTTAIMVETITNPLLALTDLAGIGSLARERGLELIVDNTFATPLLCRPLELGATVVVHSITKFLSGHSDVLLGVACADRDRCCSLQRLVELTGATPDPFAAWLAARGLRTLQLRFARQCDNARAVADYLEQHPLVSRTFYPGLHGDCGRARARSLLGEQFGAMVSFELCGGRDAVDRLIRRLNLIRFVPSLGDVDTTLSHPATTSHRGLEPGQRMRLGISDGLVRLSIGCEPVDLIIDDLAAGLQEARE